MNEKQKNIKENKSIVRIIDLKSDDSLYNRFKEALEMLIVIDRTLNERLLATWSVLMPFVAEQFPTKELQDKFDTYKGYLLKLHDKAKSINLDDTESARCARIVWDIYEEILIARSKKQ